MRIKFRAQAFILSVILSSTFASFLEYEISQHYTEQNVLMAESPKSHSPLDTGKYPMPPSGLELEQVHIYVRHGV